MASAPRTGGWSRRRSSYASVVGELGSMAVGGLRPRRRHGDAPVCHLLTTRSTVARDRPTPVVLVPGYGGGRANWITLERALAATGFVDQHVLTYDPSSGDLPSIAAKLVGTCRAALRAGGSPRVHVIGHSLGGVLLRYAVQRLGMAGSVGTAVTVASPHRGTPAARLGRSAVAASLRPGSLLLTQLEEGAPTGDVRWVAYYSDLDPIATAWSARLDDPRLRAQNVLVPNEGHLSILRAPEMVRSVCEQLLLDEQLRGRVVNRCVARETVAAA